MRRILLSLSFRLALTYVGLFAGSLLLLIAVYYVATIDRPLRAFERMVSREAAELSNTYIVDGRGALLAALGARQRAQGHQKSFYAFIDASGRIYANLPSWPRTPRNGFMRLEADISTDGVEQDFESLSLDRRFDDGARLIVGRDIGALSEREETLRAGASAILAMAVLLGVVGGGLMSRAIGRRIEDVAATARSVIAGDLSGRVPVRGSGDDFDRLAETLNLMMARIEAAMEAIRRVSDTVAHELRTPLLRLTADLRELDQSREEGERRRLLESALAETDRLATIFSAVLRIARIEAGRHEIEHEPIDLVRLAADMVSLYEPAAQLKGQTLRLETIRSAVILGDRQLLAQAIANLLDNAVKYAPPGAATRLSLADDHGVILRVENEAADVPPSDLARLTERFFRSPGSDAPGEGLGLSLVQAVADRHSSTLAFTSEDGRFEATWAFPAPRGPATRA